MVGIHQFVVGATPGDAITNMALEVRSILRQVGESDIYARYIDPSLADEAYPIWEYNPPHHRNVLIWHASAGEPQIHALLRQRSEPVVLIYHNVTPARYFEPYDEDVAALLRLGRWELASLRPRVAVAIADSQFNADELRELGYEDVRVVPPFVNPRRLLAVPPFEPTAAHLQATYDAPTLLAVGQILPHKRPDFLVQAMYIASSYLGLRAFLLLVGHLRFDSYVRAIREMIADLDVPCVRLIGPIPDAELRAFFDNASLVVSASEHEGFGVPFLEAMALGKPILARACTAVPETVGDAALLIPEHEGPAVYAEAMLALLSDETLRSELVARGIHRLEGFDARRTQIQLLSALLEVA